MLKFTLNTSMTYWLFSPLPLLQPYRQTFRFPQYRKWWQLPAGKTKINAVNVRIEFVWLGTTCRFRRKYFLKYCMTSVETKTCYCWIALALNLVLSYILTKGNVANNYEDFFQLLVKNILYINAHDLIVCLPSLPVDNKQWHTFTTAWFNKTQSSHTHQFI